MDLPDGIPFLYLPFDWYVLDKWNKDSKESKREQHIRLGIEFAQLGHEGRRPYIFYALGEMNDSYRSDCPLPSFRNTAEVPCDLLSESERRAHETNEVFWIRTDYSLGTDMRHEELLKAVDDDGTALHNPGQIHNDERLSLEGIPENSLPLYAFFPRILTPDLPGYCEPDLDYKSELVQNSLFPRLDSAKATQSHGTADYVVADAEAMRTGFLLWVHPDQYGNVIQQDRVQPYAVRTLNSRRMYFDEIRPAPGGPGYGIDEDEIKVLPWEPPSQHSLGK